MPHSTTLLEHDAPVFPAGNTIYPTRDEIDQLVEMEPQDDWWLDLGYVAIPVQIAV